MGGTRGRVSAPVASRFPVAEVPPGADRRSWAFAEPPSFKEGRERGRIAATASAWRHTAAHPAPTAPAARARPGSNRRTALGLSPRTHAGGPREAWPQPPESSGEFTRNRPAGRSRTVRQTQGWVARAPADPSVCRGQVDGIHRSVNSGRRGRARAPGSPGIPFVTPSFGAMIRPPRLEASRPRGSACSEGFRGWRAAGASGRGCRVCGAPAPPPRSRGELATRRVDVFAAAVPSDHRDPELRETVVEM